FIDFLEKARVKGAADDIVSMVSTVRAEAVKIGRDVTVSVGGTTTAWCVGANSAGVPALTQPIGTSAACDCTTAGACLVDGQPRVVSSADYSGTTISAVGGSMVIDGRLGSLEGLAGPSFDLTSPNTKYVLRVSVSPLGQASACTPSGKPRVSGYKAC